MTSEIDNDSKNTEETREVQIEELTPRMKNVNVVFKIVDVGEAREVTSRHTGEIHRVADATAGDSTGIVKIPLWDDSISNLEVDKTYKLENGYTGLFRGNLQLKIGRHSTLTESDIEIESVNLEKDMSAENHRPPRSRHYYQPGSWARGYDSGHRGSSYRRDNSRGYSNRGRFDKRRRRW